jgi:hypothetical protein
MFSDSDHQKIITVMWAIWSLRNSWTHDRGSYDPVQSIKMAQEALAVLEVPRRYVAILPGHGWRPPEEYMIKINTDGGLSMDARRGAGGVARSHSAYLVIEALALRDGVIFAKLRGFPKVVMETDYLKLTNLWNTRQGSRSAVAPILQEIGELVLSFFFLLLFSMLRDRLIIQLMC